MVSAPARSILSEAVTRLIAFTNKTLPVESHGNISGGDLHPIWSYPSLPSDFAMRGLTVWLVLPSGEQVLMYVYMNRMCGGGIVLYPRPWDSVAVSFDGHAITVTNVPTGAKVFVSVAMEYDLTGSL